MDPLLDAVYRSMHEYPPARGLNSIETVARTINRAVGTAYNKADPNNEGHALTLIEASALMRASGDYRILKALAFTLDHVAVEIGDYRGTSDLELLTLLTREIGAAGQKADAIRNALSDGDITAAEMEEIRRAMAQQIQVMFELDSRLAALAAPLKGDRG